MFQQALKAISCIVFCGGAANLSHAQSADSFYYYYGERIPLTPAPDVVAAKIQARADVNKYNGLTRRYNMVSPSTDYQGDTLLYAWRKPEAQEEIDAAVSRSYKEVFKIPAYSSGPLKLIVRNDIIVQFKATVDQKCQDLLKLQDSNVSSEYQQQLIHGWGGTSSDIDGTPGLRRMMIFNPNSTLNVANALHENCAVSYAVPNFVVLAPPDPSTLPRPVARGALGPSGTGMDRRLAFAAPEIETTARAPAACTPLSPAAPNFPNDPYFSYQWNLENNLAASQGKAKVDIRMRGAWQVTQGSAQIRVAILDDGVDITHPDLAASIAMENGKPVQWDFVGSTASLQEPGVNYGGTPDQKPAATDHHGTWVAGVIAAQLNNCQGVSGIAPAVKLIPIRMASGPPKTWDPLLARQAIEKAIILGADVINASWAVTPNQFVDQAIQHAATARGGKGIVIVASSGDDGGDLLYPAKLACAPANPNCISNVLAIGATNSWGEVKTRGSQDKEYWASNQGRALTLVAPGVSITSTDLNGLYYHGFSGTSAAAPHVAAVAALLLSISPGFTAAEVRERLKSTADKIDKATSVQAGSGHLNACRALNGANCD